ncbi:Ig-like domain-containing protein [Weeksellaceae bacterium KMM 9713]|uniref:Ig-like domain-containing protein n=1 Tax=Profundicola chukchiensis TaxID=2961959 RepID=A0A9X4MWH9_9FLAO|nr:Ig-like domain-containing protein [Profundicola chukchiensis]MDG4946161.1 Ig-like domain-containing protein [Profundicola chukchiensis]
MKTLSTYKRSLWRYILVALWLCGALTTWGQTVLERGDVVIVGVNARNGGCSDSNDVSEDIISVVFFKDITTGTQIALTDNGYDSQFNFFRNTEGYLKLQYNGTNTITAGTIIRFRLSQGSYKIKSLHPIYNNWTIVETIGSLILNNGGDQLYFLSPQNNWNSGDFNGEVLYGFSTSNWVTFNPGNSKQSNLHPHVIPCNYMNPASQTDYLMYVGDKTPATQLVWIYRIKDQDNWGVFENCTQYNSADALFEDIVILENDISLSVSPQILCEPGEVSLTFDISDSSQAYDIVYTDGSQNYSLNNITGSHVENIEVTDTTTFSLVSANLSNDPDSCPVYSDLTMQSVTVEVLSPTLITFDNDSICLGETYEFPDTQGISGTWSPASIDTTTLGTQTYTFTPNDACYSEASFDLTVVPVPDRDYIIELSNSEHNQGDQPFQLRGTYEMCGDDLFDLPLAELQALLAHFDLVLTSPTGEEIDLTDEYTDWNGILRLIAQMQGFVEEGTWQVQVFHEDDNPALPYSGSTCSWTGSIELIIHSSPDVGVISGDTEVCVGQSINLSSTVSGGIWSSENEAIATVDPNTGEVTGVAAGEVEISYTVGSDNLCPDSSESITITVNPIPITSPIEILP